MKSLLKTTLLFTVLVFTFLSCSKEKSWFTEAYISEIGTYEAETECYFDLPSNDNYVYVGVCWSTTKTPDVSDNYDEQQRLNSSTDYFTLTDLEPATTYYVRSFIKTNGKGVIYSDETSFTTSELTDPPCETIANRISIGGATYVTYPLYDTEGETYKLKTSCDFGEIELEFTERPQKNKDYITVNSALDLDAKHVKFSGILGMGFWHCYYAGSSNQTIYVRVNELGELSVQLCDFQVSTSQDCETYYTITGEMNE